VNYPFANRLFPESLDAVDRARAAGPAVIVSDGDVVFQPRKIERSGLMEAVDRNILIYVHKERELDDVEHRYPAEHYVMVDDKLWLLHAIKAHWGRRVTTVWPKQGHYVSDARVSSLPPPDVTLARIGELLAWTPERLLEAARP
jgi:FMN phosphatase YigB (HAD superfamily)